MKEDVQASKVPLAIGVVVIFFCLVGAGVFVATRYLGLETSLLVTSVLGFWSWAVKSNVDNRRAQLRLLAEEKRKQYDQFLAFLNEAMTANREGGEWNADISELRLWSLRLTLLGSDDVVTAWNDARRGADGDTPNGPVSTLRPWARLFLAMRRDCGHSSTKLDNVAVLESFVNDAWEHRSELN